MLSTVKRQKKEVLKHIFFRVTYRMVIIPAGVGEISVHAPIVLQLNTQIF